MKALRDAVQTCLLKLEDSHGEILRGVPRISLEDAERLSARLNESREQQEKLIRQVLERNPQTRGLVTPLTTVDEVCCGLIKRTPEEESSKMKEKGCSVDRKKEETIHTRVQKGSSRPGSKARIYEC